MLKIAKMKNQNGFIVPVLILSSLIILGLITYFFFPKSIFQIRPTDSHKIVISPTLSPNLINWNTYENSIYKYTIMYPKDWTITEFSGTDPTLGKPMRLVLFKSPDGNFVFSFGLKYKSEDIRLNSRTGTPAGDFVKADTLNVSGINFYVTKIVYNKKTNTVFFKSDGKDNKYDIDGDFAYIGPDTKYIDNVDLLATEEYKTVSQILSTFKFTE